MFDFKILQIKALQLGKRLEIVTSQFDKILALIPKYMHKRLENYFDKTTRGLEVHDEELDKILNLPIIKHYAEAITPIQKAIDLLRDAESQLHKRVEVYKQEVMVTRFRDETEARYDYCTTVIYFCNFVKDEKNSEIMEAIQSICYDIRE